MDTKNSQTLSPNSSATTTPTTVCNSPEFEFWMVRNPSFPQPKILSADELFVNGVLLPLHLLNKPHPPSNPPPETPPPPDPDPSPPITDSSATLSASKRWKDIFRKSDKKNAENSNAEETEKDKEKGKKKEKKSGATASAELNINIWPFSRSRSAGNAGTRPKLFPGAAMNRKVNSAPCSRSNSAGESKSRKWPSSPGRAGVHLGRSSPVWQVRRPKNPESLLLNPENCKGSKRETTASRRSKVSSSSGTGSGSAKTRVLNLNVPMCIGYRHHLSCRSDENSAIRVSGGSDIRGSNRGHANVGVKLFNLRSLFTKKSVVTSH
ncbi:hypothetical protein VNO77_05942 [Canavalia gladiata]|uniref:Uncharacterized protein n=1 Tax=Canavalia gladiata TaxID=3824 RepID=A0AAN9R639_CANGL